MTDGGYDEGYTSCPCFWGTHPAEMVVQAIHATAVGTRRRALDLGCGEGKNAVALASAGFDVLALDTSEAAVANAIRAFPQDKIQWLVADMRTIRGPKDYFDVIIATGSLHCLASTEDIVYAIGLIKSMTRRGGLNVIYAFNNGPHDMRGHSEKFSPTLLAHSSYLASYSDWEVLRASDSVQLDRHPHNGVEHSHSITRLMARRV